MNNKINILAFGSHPDDVELSAAGTLLKHKALGYKIGIIDLTRGQLGSRGTAETRKVEAEEAARILGLDARENLGFEDAFFEQTQENLLKIIYAIRKYQPDVILANAPSDRHPDHGRGAEIVHRASFLSGLVKIETFDNGIKQDVWRPRDFFYYIQDDFIKPDFIVDITDFHETKMKSIAAYTTQFYNPNDKSEEPETPISTKSFWDVLIAKDRYVGRYIQCEYGEGFIASRPYERRDLMNDE